MRYFKHQCWKTLIFFAGEEINISYLSNFDNLRNTKNRQNRLFYVWHFLCLCDWCKNKEFDTDEAFESLVQESDLHQLRRSMFVSSKEDPRQGPLKKWTEHSQNCIFWKYILGGRGSSYYNPGLDGRLIFWTISFHNPKKFISRSF